MSKTGNLKHKDQVSLIISAVIYMSMNNLCAIAETAPAANSMRTTQVPVQATASASSVPLIIGIVALVIVGVVVFMMTKKQDNKKSGNSGSNKISPPLPGAKSTVSTPKTPVALPPKINVQPKADPVVAPQPSAPIIPPAQPKPSVVAPKVETPVVPAAMAMPNIAPPVQPASFSTNSDAKPLFDSGKLDSDLDNIFTDPKAATKVEEVQKAPLFDSSQLDDDLDALFVEVNKKPEKPKEEKKGLFDSSQLDSDLDNLFAEESSPKNDSSNNLDSLFDSAPAPKEPAFQAPSTAPTFDLDDLNFLSNDTKKEEPQASSPALDLSSLNFDMPSTEPAKTASNSTFDLDDLNFLANDTKKEEPKSNALPTLNLSDIVNSTNSSALDSAPLSAGKVDLNNTTMGLNISDYLNSMQKPEEKKNDDSFSLSNTIPPHSLNLKDLNLDNLSVSKNSIDTTDKKDSGVISIGKMLVDQNALEEIIKKAEKGGKAGLTTTQVITAVKGRSLDTLLVDINNVSGILGSIIVGKDGLVIANTMPDNIDKDLVGALTSSLFTNIDTQIKKMKKGNLKRLTVETGSGVYILTEIEMGTLVVFGQEGQKVNLSDIYKSITAVTGKK